MQSSMSSQQTFIFDTPSSPKDSHKVSIVISKNTSSTCSSKEKLEVTVVDSKTNTSQIFEVELPEDLKTEKKDQTGYSQQSSTIDETTPPIEKESIVIQDKKKKKRFGFLSKMKNKLKKALNRLGSSKAYNNLKIIISMISEFFALVFGQL